MFQELFPFFLPLLFWVLEQTVINLERFFYQQKRNSKYVPVTNSVATMITIRVTPIQRDPTVERSSFRWRLNSIALKIQGRETEQEQHASRILCSQVLCVVRKKEGLERKIKRTWTCWNNFFFEQRFDISIMLGMANRHPWSYLMPSEQVFGNTSRCELQTAEKPHKLSHTFYAFGAKKEMVYVTGVDRVKHGKCIWKTRQKVFFELLRAFHH